METEYRIVSIDHPEQSAWGIIGKGINDYNHQQAGDSHSQVLCFALVGQDQEIAGGVVAQIYWDWLYIDLMWMKAELRGHGFGGRLLTLVEDEARKRGAKHAHLDTFSFQAPDFYQKHGYQVFGALQDFPQGSQRYYLMKEL